MARCSSTAAILGLGTAWFTVVGTGLISAPVTMGVNGTLAPGVSIGTLTINNALTLTGTNVMEVSGGTLKLVVVGPLSGGEVFRLFEAASGGYSGNCTTYDLPPLDASLMWDSSSVPVNGTLRVTGGVELPQIGTAVRTGDGNFQFSGTAARRPRPRPEHTSDCRNCAWHYPITVTAGSLSAANYAFTFVDGEFTVDAVSPLPPSFRSGRWRA